jgi:rRNA maturation endonuclease Nob1
MDAINITSWWPDDETDLTPAHIVVMLASSSAIEYVTLLRCACGDKEVTESWVPADMCGRCGMPLRRVEVERRRR